MDLDKIIADSGSVEDVVAALQSSQESTKSTAAQLVQLAEAARGSMSPMQWIKDKMSPNSVGGTLATADEYRRHVIEAAEAGEEPLSREEFNKQYRQRKQQKSSQSKQAG